MKIKTPHQKFFRNGRLIETEGRVHLSMGLLRSAKSNDEDQDTGKFHVICNQRGYFGSIVPDETELTCGSCIRLNSNWSRDQVNEHIEYRHPYRQDTTGHHDGCQELTGAANAYGPIVCGFYWDAQIHDC